MALIQCRECGHAVSKKAKDCPSCGAPIAKKSPVTKGLAAIAAIGFGLAASIVAGTVWVMNSQESMLLPMATAFAFGAIVGWHRVMK